MRSDTQRINSQPFSRFCAALGCAVGWWCGMLLLVHAVSLAARAQDALPPARGVRLPLERYPDGSVRRQLLAETADMRMEGPIRATGVRVEMFATNGVLEMVVEAPECVYDRVAERVTSTNTVMATGRGLSLQGLGFEWDIEKEQLHILADVRLEFSRKSVNRKKKQ